MTLSLDVLKHPQLVFDLLEVDFHLFDLWPEFVFYPVCKYLVRIIARGELSQI